MPYIILIDCGDFGTMVLQERIFVPKSTPIPTYKDAIFETEQEAKNYLNSFNLTPSQRKHYTIYKKEEKHADTN